MSDPVRDERRRAYGPFALRSYPCPLCTCARTRAVMRKSGDATGDTFEIVACAQCGHVRTDPRIPDERLHELYDAGYYRGEGFDRSLDYDAPVTAGTLEEVAAIVATVRDALDRPLRGARWLDVGCGMGTLLHAVREAGAEAAGSDDSRAAKDACARAAIPVLERRELDARRGSFDVASAIEVIEHVPDPLDFVRSLASLVRPGGVVYVHTGNWNLVRYLPGQPYVMPEGHIHYFTPPEMRRIFARCGLREARAFNRAWFGWRHLPNALRARVPPRPLGLVQAALVRAAPGFAPYPVGIRIP